MATLRVCDLVRILQELGFRHKRTIGSHRQFERIVGGKRRLVKVAAKKVLAWRDPLVRLSRAGQACRGDFSDAHYSVWCCNVGFQEK